MRLDLWPEGSGANVDSHEDAMSKIEQRIKDLHRETVLAGSAGVGKTTLIGRLIRKLPGGMVVPLAPTGRAARRLTEELGVPAQTIHSAMYGQPSEDRYGNLLWPDPKPIGTPGGLVVVDESSMCGKTVADDIRLAVHAEASILWVGDPYQLPPVDDLPGVDLFNPDIRLTKVYRSGAGIMRFAYLALQCETVPELQGLFHRASKGEYNNVVRAPKEWTPERWRATALKSKWDSSLITYTNVSRRSLNSAVRYAMDLPRDALIPGEPLCVLANSHELGLCNGDVVYMRKDISEDDPDLPKHLRYVELDDVERHRVVHAYLDPTGFSQEDSVFRERRRQDSLAWSYKLHFKSEKWRQLFEARQNARYRRGLQGPAAQTAHVTFGYAKSCHREQGHGYDIIGVVWENWNHAERDVDFARRWMYTAWTRAKQKVVFWS